LSKSWLNSSGQITPNIDINVDFQDNPISGSIIIDSTDASRWGIDLWGVGRWSGGAITSQEWVSVSGIGYSAALKVDVYSNHQSCNWQGWEIMFERGGLI